MVSEFEYLISKDTDGYRRRLVILFAVAAVFFLMLLMRLFYLQIIQGHEYARLSENNCIRLQSIPPHRGLIYDRHGALLVDNRPAYDLLIVPGDVGNMEEVLGRLAVLSDIPVSEFQERLERERGPGYRAVLLRQDLDRDAVGLISARRYDLPGVRIEARPRRQYMYPGLAAHLIGYLGEVSPAELQRPENKDLRGGDFIGKTGVERVYDAVLRGERGGRQVEVNVRGQVIRILHTVPAKPGGSLYLALDRDLQSHTESLMEGRVGAVVALDPTNGQVLAMVSSPSFDQNLFARGIRTDEWRSLAQNPHRPMENKAIQGLYPPASTYKMISAIAALEEGVVDSETRFFCSGSLRFGDRNFRCWRRTGHGNLNLREALERSCDVYFYHVAQRLGVDRLAWYARAAGFGRRTGVDLDHEEAGLVPTAGWKRRRTGVSWQAGETLSVIIGQGYNLATCMQAAVMTAALGNGGILFRPQVALEIRKTGGEVMRPFTPEVTGRLPVSPENLELVRLSMRDVVHAAQGTARGIRTSEFDMGGKTGTAQVLSRRTDEEESSSRPGFEPHAWFVAFAPYDDPRIAVAVIVEHGEGGARVAAPIAAEVMRSYLVGSGEK
ncbi:peptidoglycan glycosyltransferase [Desulfobotulus alkaliphilus]|uniref:Peptidoglycan glycosyltransferase n=1 Tax=Desulfobotulus alkaliphilus TaxID=622671 RepID=A0A562RIM3_9BACT|nr:penicillin-binding protein 2 [Desulfobotulus alkaliphilus]TWI68216.1 peptidoglycan glycosyltransferase [Desulfobotulus alkaliphilus]